VSAGRICLDILKDKWSPALQVRTVLLSIQALLSAPNPEDPLDTNVAEHWKTDEVAAIAEGLRAGGGGAGRGGAGRGLSEGRMAAARAVSLSQCMHASVSESVWVPVHSVGA
jgi:hypothetical protein